MHDRYPGETGREPGAGQIIVDCFLNVGYDVAQTAAHDDIWIKREDDQCQLAVLRQQLTADDLVVHHALDQPVIFCALGQLLRKQRRRQLPALWWLASRKYRDDAPRAFDQLKVGDDIAQLFDRSALKEVLALDHDKDIEFVRREAPCHLFERLELGRVGSEQLTERIVDLDTR